MADRYSSRRELVFDELIESFRRANRSLVRAYNALQRYSGAQQGIGIVPLSSAPINGNITEVGQAINGLHSSLHSIDRHLRTARSIVAAEIENSQPGPDTHNMNMPTNNNGDSSLSTTRACPHMLGYAHSVDCCICMDPMPLGSLVAILPCSHFMHECCILRWLEHTNACPLCRQRVFEN